MRYRQLRTRDVSEDAGFTLIELLVVIVIIAILASIAIPVFLNQRRKAEDTAAKSALRNFAQFEETYLAGYGTYTDVSGLQNDGNSLVVSKGTTLTIEHVNGAMSYCLSAQTAGGHVWFYDPLAGGIQSVAATDCPNSLSQTGAAGQSVSNP